MNKRFLTLIITVCLCFCGFLTNVSASAVPSRNPLPFRDVGESDWYYESVRYAYENNLFSGTDDGIFSPKSSMNRAMLVTVLYRMEGEPAVLEHGDEFCDVPRDSYYKNAVIWASSRGIVTGTGGEPSVYADGTVSKSFSPQNPITREQLAVILYRYAVLYQGMDAAITTDLRNSVDGGQVAGYAKEAVAWCVSKGVIEGDILFPKSNATRAEVASMLYRLSQLRRTGGGGYQEVLKTLASNGGGKQPVFIRSMYDDINGDGTAELLTLYETANREGRAAVYTMQGGKAVRLLDEHAYYNSGTPLANYGVVTMDGKPHICLQSENGGSSNGIHSRGGTCRLYSVTGAKAVLTREIIYGDWSGEKDMDYASFQSWLKSQIWVDIVVY